jgi:hypothetical protein
VPLPLDESDSTYLWRYRLTVVAASVAEVVGSAGGWLCDRARAGWDVNVVVADSHDARPLTILGASARGLDGELAEAVTSVAKGATLAISPQLLADERIRGHVVNLMKRGVADVMVWGGDWPTEFGKTRDRVDHTLSSAARAFKAMALGASHVSERAVDPTETLYLLGAESLRPLHSV